MSASYDVIVIGAGSMGASTCWHLARMGQRVLGLDRYEVPHTFGSHHGHSRMIRMSYFEHPDYVPLLKRSYELWGELEVGSNHQILIPTGGLYMSPPNGLIVSGCVKAAREHDLSHELLDHETLRRQFPQFTVPEDYSGYYESVAGVLMVKPALETFIEQTRLLGGEILGDQRVLSWRAEGDSVCVRTDTETYHAGRLVITSGAWAGELVCDLGLPLQVTRQTMFWIQPAESHSNQIGLSPSWFIESAPGKGLYGFPPLPGREGMKLADHSPGKDCHAETVNRECCSEDWAAFRPLGARFLSQTLKEPLAMEACLYTSTPDGHFVLDQHPEYESVTFGAGFSGHGFKFAPVVGEILAQFAMEGETRFPVRFLSLNRFDPKCY